MYAKMRSFFRTGDYFMITTLSARRCEKLALKNLNSQEFSIYDATYIQNTFVSLFLKSPYSRKFFFIHKHSRARLINGKVKKFLKRLRAARILAGLAFIWKNVDKK